MNVGHTACLSLGCFWYLCHFCVNLLIIVLVVSLTQRPYCYNNVVYTARVAYRSGVSDICVIFVLILNNCSRCVVYPITILLCAYFSSSWGAYRIWALGVIERWRLRWVSPSEVGDIERVAPPKKYMINWTYDRSILGRAYDVKFRPGGVKLCRTCCFLGGRNISITIAKLK